MSRQLATVNGYAGLIAAIRARKTEMRISDAELEEIAGLTKGHVSKLLAAGASKVLGPLSMGRLLRALGLELIVAENADQTAAIRKLYVPRDENQVRRIVRHAIACGSDAPWLFNRKNAGDMARKGWSALPREKRVARAKKAARTRKRKRLQLARMASTA